MAIRLNFNFAGRRVVFEKAERGIVSLELGVVGLETQNAKLKTSN